MEATLIAAAAQLLFLEASDHAAVDLAVRAVRADPASAPYVALANAVLRNIARAKAEIVGDADPLDDTPAWLAARWRAHYGEETTRAHRRRAPPGADARPHGEEPTPRAGRASSAGWCCRPARCGWKPTRRSRSWKVSRKANGGCRTPPPRCRRGCSASRPATASPISAPRRAARPRSSPPRGARVSALDRSAQRLKRVASNLERLKLEAELVVANAATYDAPPFDAVLIDAPCASTGTIRRHPDVAWTKRQADIAALAKTQAELLARAVALTKRGGTIVYCTCSLEPEEGEAQIAALPASPPRGHAPAD